MALMQIEPLSGTPRLRRQKNSRIAQIAREIVPKSDMKVYAVESDDIEDRISYLEMEINEGKRSERVRQIASGILTAKDESGQWRIAERDWRGELQGAFDFVREHVRYTRDIQDVELFQRADRTLELGIGDCDDMAILLGSIIGNIGFPTIVRVISTDGPTFHHVYLLAGLPPEDPKEWIALDASQGEGVGWEVAGIVKKQDYYVSTF